MWICWGCPLESRRFPQESRNYVARSLLHMPTYCIREYEYDLKAHYFSDGPTETAFHTLSEFGISYASAQLAPYTVFHMAMSRV